MTLAPAVSVIVPHYNDLERLDVCLAALGRQTLPAERFEVIVSDNASPQGPAAVAAVIAGRATLVIAPERGAGPTRNRGVEVSGNAILAFTDSDCIPAPGWLDEGLKALAGADVDFVGGRMTVFARDPANMTPSEAFEMVFAFDNEGYIRRKGFTVSANLFCPRALFDRVGGFGVGLSEDLDWCRRATTAGYRIGYAPLAEVAHPARHSWAELKTKWRRVNAETYSLYADTPTGRLKWLARGLALPVSAVVHAPRIARKTGLTLSQRLSALRVLFGVRFWRCADAFALLANRRG